MKDKKKIIWGIVWIAIGIFVALNWFDVINVDIFFDGWWTLFIIVPGVIGLITEKDKVGNLVVIGIGVMFLLWQQDVFSFDMMWKIALPVLIVLGGVKMLVGGFKHSGEKDEPVFSTDGKTKTYTAVFGGCDANLSAERVENLKCVAVFGGVECDLRSAIIEGDCKLQCVAVFGGVDILVPANVNVKIHSTAFFGGVDNEEHQNLAGNTATLHVYTTTVFGGVEIK